VTSPSVPLVVGVAVVDRSGRFRDRVLMSALGWVAGDRIDSRDQVFIVA
jgi:hypothetical protein